MQNALYIARAGLPMDATGIRIEAIGALLKKAGYHIHYICERRVDHQVTNSSFHKLTPMEIAQYPDAYLNITEEHYEESGSIYSYLPSHHNNKMDSIKDTVEIYTASRAFRRVQAFCEKENPDIIILYNDIYGLTKKLIPYCRKKKILLLADVTEWYEKRKKAPIAERMIVYLTDKRIRTIDRKLDGVISISPFFDEYYSSIGVKSILIPPLMRIQKEEFHLEKNFEQNQMIRFVYAGSPGSKDIIIPFVQGIIRANHKSIASDGKKKFQLDLVGVDSSYLHANGCQEANEAIGITPYGRLSHNDTLAIIKNADFGILLRHDQRYAKAGFSTKFSECMSLGVAMVCNRIGGTDRFVENGVDGFILENLKNDAIDQLLDMLSVKSREFIVNLKKNAFLKASQVFNIEHYVRNLSDFLKGGKRRWM